ncbi:helix-turn-helix transcriptional regulator [Burkholderia metallica]|uniref:helix-turn-helix transcriptional regulator n=1 Tax=Burkholderia metallica TaxID=488729 RepID=UPI001CF54CD4|nr:helix-turn-helix transcriptional regulator [Burkholderia metallica]MCA8002718.1 helix-turn-helix transcriptional regulator [Burkholderia metallica]
MLVTFYFPYVSMLSAASVPSAIGDLIRNGNIQAAASQIQRCVDEQGAGSSADLLQMQGDLQLYVGLDLDADESYREAQKSIRDDKGQMRFRSCRNAGWQALFRYRYGTAMSCFTQIVDHPNVESTIRLEALFGVFSVLLSVGRLRDADAVLDMLEDLSDEARSDDAPAWIVDGWQSLLRTVRFDVEVQSELRSRAELTDHIYWQVGLSGNTGFGAASVHPQSQRMRTGTVIDPLLSVRLAFLKRLGQLAGGEREVQREVMEHVEWACRQGNLNYQSSVRIEVVLVSLAGGVLSLAETMLSLLAAEVRIQQSHRQLEYLYCLAKLRHMQGRSNESLEVYTRYALAAVNCIRDESNVLVRYGRRIARPQEQLDDIGTRLPARYRRAYRYLLDNLERKDLSIREIAAQIGVTDRALQSAFKTSLGSTPTEIIRRLRMERIRAELEDAGAAHERGILAAAVKWGVSNRSTLVNNYRREFDESPSDTLNR